MDKKLLTRLKHYSIQASALAGVTAAQAQVMHTNVQPDTLITGIGNAYDLDLNNDGTIDFIIDIGQESSSGSFTFTSGFFAYSNATTGVRISPTGNNAVMGWWPTAMNAGQIIQSMSYGWITYSNRPVAQQIQYFQSYSFVSYYGGSYTGSISGTWSNGNFIEAEGKYMGLRLELNGNYHFGWVRLDVPSIDTFLVKEYAVNLDANEFMMAGDTGLIDQAMPALEVAANDLGSAGDGSDITVEFDAAENEETVMFYRLIAVKDANASSFNLAAAQAVGSGRYLPVLPTGSFSYTEPLFAGQLDSDGDAITTDVPYRIFVHSVAQPLVAAADTLSTPSNVVTLDAALTGEISPVTAVSIVDVDNEGNGLDMEVSFNAIADESFLAEYRVLVVKASSAAGFGLSAAETNTNYFTVAPAGQAIISVLADDSRDTDGDLIENNVPYRAFVLALADGLNAIENYLSPASNELTLQNTLGGDEVKADGIVTSYNEAGVLVQFNNERPSSIEVIDVRGSLVARLANQSSVQLVRGELAAGAYLLMHHYADGRQGSTKVMMH